jgi:hypothetical protein
MPRAPGTPRRRTVPWRAQRSVHRSRVRAFPRHTFGPLATGRRARIAYKDRRPLPSPVPNLTTAPPGARRRSMAAAGAMDGSHGEAPVPAGAGPNKPHPTFPCTCPSSLACRLTRSPVTPPVQQAAVATVPGRRRRPSPAFSLPHPSPGTGSLGPKAPPPPVPGRPRPAVGRNLAGPPLPGRPGTTLQRRETFQGPNCERVTPIVK